MAKKRPLTDDELRALIPAQELIDILVANSNGTLDPPLNQNRLHSIRILLDKRLPNLASQTIDHSGDVQIEVLTVASHD